MTLSILIVIIALMVPAIGLLLLFMSRDHYFAGAFKMLASTCFITLCVAAGGIHSPYGWAILAGLVFSWWGDLFLISKSSIIFMMGLVAFFLAHVAYCVAFIFYGMNPYAALAALGIMLVPGVFLVRWLYPHLGNMRLPVLAYMLIITVMVSLAAGIFLSRGGVLMVIGAAIFYCSDIFVARDRFVAPGKINALVGLPLYYAGQILIALSVIYLCE